MFYSDHYTGDIVITTQTGMITTESGIFQHRREFSHAQYEVFQELTY